MDVRTVQLPELSAKAYGVWADRMRRNLPPSSKPARIPAIVAEMLDAIASQAAQAGGRGQRIMPEIRVPLGFVDGIVRQLQRLSALTPRKEASSDLEEVGWLIELALRRATRSPSAQATERPAPPAPVVVPEPEAADEPSPIEKLEAQVRRLQDTSAQEEEAQEEEEEEEQESVLEGEPAAQESDLEGEPAAQEEPAPTLDLTAATEAVVLDEPPGEELTVDEPPPDELAIEEPPDGKLVADESPTDELVLDRPSIEELVADEPAGEEVADLNGAKPIAEPVVDQIEEDAQEDDPAGREGTHAPIRVLLVDDEPRTLAMLAVALKGERDIEIVGLAPEISEAAAIARTTQPDVAVVDVRMPRGGGPQAARAILALSPATRILAYSALDERRAVLSMLEAGAVGYLVKGGPQEEVAAAIRKTMLGERPLSTEVRDEVMKALTERVRLEADDRESYDELERQVRRFLSGRDLRMAWQPIVHLHSRDVVGAEALPRFEGHPKRSPDGWFREAWRMGFGPELEGAVLEAAADRLDQLPENLYIAVNLSPACLVERGFLDSMKHLPWERLVVEVTERSSVDDYAQLRAAAREIRRRGGQLAVDDAGAAFASLRHVAEIEPDLVKMDERVCRNIHIDPRMHALATALISFARELGAEFVAEGIEHRGQLDALKEIGVEYGQGPFFTGLGGEAETKVRAGKRRRARR